MAPSKKTKEFDFEATLKELNELVEKMEQGNLSLEASLKGFERGVGLVRACQETLEAAEQKVRILTDKNVLEAYENSDDSV